MQPQEPAIPAVEAAVCPLYRPVDGKGRYCNLGCCTGLPNGLLMIPSVAECRSLCCSPAHVLCPVFRSRSGQGSLETWLQAEPDPWVLRPLLWPSPPDEEPTKVGHSAPPGQ